MIPGYLACGEREHGSEKDRTNHRGTETQSKDTRRTLRNGGEMQGAQLLRSVGC